MSENDPKRSLLHSRIGRLWNVADHSALMLAARITLPPFGVSSARTFRKGGGGPERVAPPMSTRRAFSLGSARAALISLLSLSTISAGVFLGAATPYQPLDS